MKVTLPALPRGSGPFDLDALRRFGVRAIEFDRAIHAAHDAKLRTLAQEVVDAFESPDDYQVPRLWIVKIEKLRAHLRGAKS